MRRAVLGQDVHADMAEQPDVVARLFARHEEIVDGIGSKGLLPARGVMLVARGSSDNAAVYARYLLELATRAPVALAAPSLYTRYHSQTRVDGWTVVAISQSGATPEIVTTVDALCAQGARAIAITNDAESPLVDRCEFTIALDCGPERAIPATKTFTASLAAIAAIARAVSPDAWSEGDERHVVESLSAVLADREPLGAIAEGLLGEEMISHLGRGFGFAVALEGALKYREMTGRVAEGISASDYLHGPIAAANSRTCVVAYLNAGPTTADVRSTANAAKSRGAHLVLVTDDREGTDGAQELLVPREPVEALSVFALALRAQQLAFACAERAGIDPDKPVGLHKITLTA
ncbi:MAG: SIS domain-containing protein [Acidimicrobiales bacterium]|jgi:glucosamine--fructose-6-phosphate aminotransferase (isomerizing)